MLLPHNLYSGCQTYSFVFTKAFSLSLFLLAPLSFWPDQYNNMKKLECFGRIKKVLHHQFSFFFYFSSTIFLASHRWPGRIVRDQNFRIGLGLENVFWDQFNKKNIFRLVNFQKHKVVVSCDLILLWICSF